MRAGFAIQFIGLPAEARDLLARPAQGQTSIPAPSPKPLADDPLAEALLNMLRRRMSNDPYMVLSLPLDATFDAVRQNVHNVRRNVESIAARPLSARQLKDLTELRSRIETAVSQLDNPRQQPSESHAPVPTSA